MYVDEGKYIRIKHLYENVLEKLVYFVLTEGWGSFVNRSKIVMSESGN